MMDGSRRIEIGSGFAVVKSNNVVTAVQTGNGHSLPDGASGGIAPLKKYASTSPAKSAIAIGWRWNK